MMLLHYCLFIRLLISFFVHFNVIIYDDNYTCQSSNSQLRQILSRRICHSVSLLKVTAETDFMHLKMLITLM